MTYLIGRAGASSSGPTGATRPRSRRRWPTCSDARGRRRDGLRLKPFYAEFVGYRWGDQAAFDAGLELAGPQAVADFARAMGVWSRQGHVPGRVAVDEG
jgi:hypothetical protein